MADNLLDVMSCGVGGGAAVLAVNQGAGALGAIGSGFAGVMLSFGCLWSISNCIAPLCSVSGTQNSAANEPTEDSSLTVNGPSVPTMSIK